MRLTLWGMVLSLASVGLVSCTKKATGSETTSTRTPTSENLENRSAAQSGWVPLPVTLPKQAFKWNVPSSRAGVSNLEPGQVRPRPDFLAPVGVTNVALGSPVTASMDPPVKGELSQLVDGDKEATEEGLIDLGPSIKWVQIDLGSPHELWAILFWHFHLQECVYYDVVVQVADDPDFIANVRTLFHNDIDNSSGLGVGHDQNYGEDHEGKLVNARQEVARYVRLYSHGNNLNDRNHYLEIEVYGRPAK
ncbi:MAG: hypothetical protein HQ515_18045 [Phycisphaeraceae bacterium]|nr:hypothetical protein [Phycisphaeraceae bacterium]